MASHLIDKLEALKEDENNIKEQQRVLQEQIELEIEKKRRLELDGTITKLRTQVDEISKNIQGEIMIDNYPLIREQETINFQNDCNTLSEKRKRGLLNDTEVKRQSMELTKKKEEIDKKYQNWKGIEKDTTHKRVTLEKFKDNLSKVSQEIKERRNNGNDRLGKAYIKIPHEIKIYDDIMPIFNTMIGIMKKQEFEIDSLKSKVGRIVFE